jgi:hypothetical protein
MNRFYARYGTMVLAVAALTAVQIGSAAAQSKREAPVAAPAATPAAPNLAATTAEVIGFRSARFGMTENEVRTAIGKDFNLKGDAIKAETNRNEQTRILTARVQDVLPGGGGAEVSYVFGFKTKKLIQVGLSWSKATDDKITPEQLFSNSTVLRSHFLAAGYKPDTVATNMPISGGLLMFRGSDANERTTLLILQGTLSQAEKNPSGSDQRVLTPTGLLLFYVADAKAPDVYRLPAGSF